MRHPVRVGMIGLAAAALAGPVQAASDDLTVVSTVNLGKGAPLTSTQYISTGRIRTSNGESDTIFDAGTGRVVILNNKKKEYFEFTREELAEAMRGFESQMQSAGPLMEKMMGGPVGEVTVKKTGASRKVAGYACDEYTIAMGENLRYDVCAAPGLQPPSHYFDALKSPFAVMGPMSRRFDRLFEEMKKVKGFPVAMSSSVKIMTVSNEMKQEATEIKKGPVPASAFDIPAGYRKKDSPFKKK